MLCNAEVVPLTAKVFDTLLLLVENSGHLVEKDELIERLWPDNFVDESSLTQNISLLRKALGDGQNGVRFIETVPKRGYRFVAVVKEVGDEPLEPQLSASPAAGARTTSAGPGVLDRIRQHRRASAAIAVALVLAVISGWWATKHYVRAGPPLPFQERDWVLVTSFENRTGDPLFDGAVEYAVERELSNSTFVFVISRERAEDALRLMKKPPDMKVDAAVGKEICLRDGAIRALVTGRTDKLGSTYELSASLVDPWQGHTVATHSEEAPDQTQIASAVRRLSNWVRESLGEALASIRQSNQELEKVTTPSLRALQFYAQADAGQRERGNAFAEQLFRQAIIEDPGFASAHIRLAWTLHNQRKPNVEWMQASERALQLSEQVSERERLFIAGSYYMMRDQYDKFLPAFEVLVQRYPDHFWGTNNLAESYYSLGRYNEALRYRTKQAQLRPNDFQSQVGATSLSVECLQMDEASRYARLAKELITQELIKGRPYATSYIEYFLVSELWFRGDYEGALRELDRLAQTVDARGGQERDAYVHGAVYGYLRFGKLKTAQELAEKISPEGNRGYDLALVDFTRNDKARLKSDLLKDEESPMSRPLTKQAGNREPFLVRAGLLSEAQRTMSTIGDPGELKVYEGELALAQGKAAQAVSLLQAGINLLRPGDRLFLMAAFDSLAAAYERQGDVTNRLRVLEEASNETFNEVRHSGRVFGFRSKSQLAELYRKLNRPEDAQRVEDNLLSLLRFADPDHPILTQIKQARSK